MIIAHKQRDLEADWTPAQWPRHEKAATGWEGGFCSCCGDAMGAPVACIHFHANGKVTTHIIPNTESEGR